MNTFEIQELGGDVISCAGVPGSGEKMLIAAHGFGSSALSPTNRRLMQVLPERTGCGVVSFDFPEHGASRAGRTSLRIGICMDYLAAVENAVHARSPQAEILYFGSSFGAYITALYLSLRSHRGSRAFFRSAAVTMPQILLGQSNPAAEAQLAEQGWFALDYPGYVRPLELTAEFLQDLREHDLFKLYKPGPRLTMLHGSADETAPYEAAQRFARFSGAALITVPGGHHSLSEGEQPSLMADAAAEFVLGR